MEMEKVTQWIILNSDNAFFLPYKYGYKAARGNILSLWKSHTKTLLSITYNIHPDFIGITNISYLAMPVFI